MVNMRETGRLNLQLHDSIPHSTISLAFGVYLCKERISQSVDFHFYEIGILNSHPHVGSRILHCTGQSILFSFC